MQCTCCTIILLLVHDDCSFFTTKWLVLNVASNISCYITTTSVCQNNIFVFVMFTSCSKMRTIKCLRTTESHSNHTVKTWQKCQSANNWNVKVHRMKEGADFPSLGSNVLQVSTGSLGFSYKLPESSSNNSWNWCLVRYSTT